MFLVWQYIYKKTGNDCGKRFLFPDFVITETISNDCLKDISFMIFLIYLLLDN